MKFVLTFVVACMAFQTISASPSLKKDNGLVTIVKGILKIVVNGVETVYEDLDKFFDEYSANSKVENQEVIDFLDNLGYKITEDIIQDIGKLFDGLEQNATAKEKQVMTCIRKEKEHVISAVNGSVDGITKCVLGEVPLVIKDGSDLLHAFNSTLTSLKTAEESLENCELGELCLLQLLSDLGKIKLDDLIKAANEFLKKMSEEAAPEWDECFETESEKIITNIVGIFNETVTCFKA